MTRTPEEALAKIVEFEAQLRAGDSTTLAQRFAELAQTESHCSSARAGGDLGPFGCARPLQLTASFVVLGFVE